MTAQKKWWRRSTSFLASATAGLLVTGGMVAIPAVAHADEAAQPGVVADATLDWGVKASFRNYIYNFTMFEGRTTMLGSATQPEPKGIYHWSTGSGNAKTDGSSADVDFGAGNGVHFQSHPMTVDGEKVYALDMTFTNPHVVLTSPTTGELRMDVAGYEFKSMTEVGDPYELTDANIAELELPAPAKSGDTLTWSDAAATLTDEGAIAFGGFYPAETELDPVTFSLPTTAATPAVQVVGSTDVVTGKSRTVTVKGSGFVPDAPTTSGTRPPLAGKFTGAYVAFGSYADAWTPSSGAAAGTRVGLDVKWAVPAESLETVGGAAAGGIVLGRDGTFETKLTLKEDAAKALADGRYGIVTYSGGGAKYAPFETFTPVNFVEPFATTTKVKFTKTTLGYNSANRASVQVSGVGEGAAQTPTGKVSLTLYGKTYRATLKQGKASILLNKVVNAGTRGVKVSYTSDADEFLGSSVSTKIKVVKAKPKVSTKFSKNKITTKQNAKLKIVVALPGSLGAKASKAKVQIFDGKKWIKSAYLNSSGKAYVKLPKLKKGTHKVKVKFVGTSNISAKYGVARALKVTKKK